MAGKSDRPDTEGPDDGDKGEEQGAPDSAREDQSGAGEGSALVQAEQDALAGDSSEAAVAEQAVDLEEEQLAAQLGVQKYVHAAFFAAGILAAYLLGKILQSAWNTLAEWPEAVRQVPLLLEYTEDERGSVTLVIGAVLGVLLILRYYRRPSVRSWATDVAGELARVTWPSKDTVTNGTIVVLVAGAVATFYVAVLDRLWSYLTNLVYGT